MEIDRAKEIIQALADGVDSCTGEYFAADGPYQPADTVQAPFTILEAADPGRKAKKPVDPAKTRAGGKMTEEEEKQRNVFYPETPIGAIVKGHGRISAPPPPAWSSWASSKTTPATAPAAVTVLLTKQRPLLREVTVIVSHSDVCIRTTRVRQRSQDRKGDDVCE